MLLGIASCTVLPMRVMRVHESALVGVSDLIAFEMNAARMVLWPLWIFGADATEHDILVRIFQAAPIARRTGRQQIVPTLEGTASIRGLVSRLRSRKMLQKPRRVAWRASG